MSALTQIQVPDGTTYEFKDSGALRAAAAAPEFSASTAYAVGDAVTKDGLVYRCTAAHAAGAWNAAHFAALDPIQAQLDAADPRYALDTASPTTAWKWIFTATGSVVTNPPYVVPPDPVWNGSTWTCDFSNTGLFSDNELDTSVHTYNASSTIIYFYNPDVSNYSLTAIRAVTLDDRAVKALTLSSASTVLALPTPQTGKTSDFVLDVTNAYSVSSTATAAAIEFLGALGTDFNIVVPDGSTLSDETSFEPEEYAELYFTLSAFAVGSKPTWSVTKRAVSVASAS